MWNGVIGKNFMEEAQLNLAYKMSREKTESTSVPRHRADKSQEKKSWRHAWQPVDQVGWCRWFMQWHHIEKPINIKWAICWRALKYWSKGVSKVVSFPPELFYKIILKNMWSIQWKISEIPLHWLSWSSLFILLLTVLENLQALAAINCI